MKKITKTLGGMKFVGGRSKEEKVKVTFDLPKDLLKQLDKVADEENVSRQRVAIRLIKAALQDKDLVIDLSGHED